MATATNQRQSAPPLSAVLPLAPLEYDYQWANTLVRVLNFFIQQLQNPGLVQGNQLTIQDSDHSTKFEVDPQLTNDVLTIILTNLPTSATGLAKGQLWNNSGVINIVT